MTSASPPLTKDSDDAELARKFVYYYIILTPVLWALGVLVPLGAVLVLGLVLRAPIKAWATDGLLLAWALVAAAQGVSVLYNCADSGAVLSCLPRRLPSSVVSGWLILGLALFVGRYYRLATPMMVRAISILGAWLLAFSLFSLALYYLAGTPELVLPSPLAPLIPSSLPAVQYHFTMTFFTNEEFLGSRWPRLTLFYPWPVALSFTGIAIFFISLRDPSRFWRLLGTLGACLAIVTSLSRAGYVIFVAGLGILAWLHIERGSRWALAFAALGVALLVLAANPALVNLAEEFYEAFTNLRPGSSSARFLVYKASFSHFLERPIIGFGWPGPNLHERIPIALGSHSSIFGVLYTGGLLTFLPLCLAAVITLGRLFLRAQQRDENARAAFLIFFALAVIAYGEGVYSFVIPALPVFLWIGGTFADERRRAGTDADSEPA